VPGKRVELFEFSRVDAAKIPRLLGEWQTKLYVTSDRGIVNGHPMDSDHELVAR